MPGRFLTGEPRDAARGGYININLFGDGEKQEAGIFEAPFDIGNREVRGRDKFPLAASTTMTPSALPVTESAWMIPPLSSNLPCVVWSEPPSLNSTSVFEGSSSKAPRRGRADDAKPARQPIASAIATPNATTIR